jgi:chaperonin GroES
MQPNSNYQGLPTEAAPVQPDISEPTQNESPLSDALQKLNLAEGMDKKKLDEIGDEVWQGYDRDLKSKDSWDKQIDEWVKLASQIREEKSFPWPNASNVKYPLLATAAMQFAARAYPSLVPADGKVVQFKVVGADPEGMKAAKADKLAKHMNYQLIDDMAGWEEEMDRLLIQLPIVGCLFKKTYFDDIKKKNASKLIGPKSLVVNYWATSLADAYRKTEIIPMTKNEIKSRVTAGLFLDVDLHDPKSNPALPTKADTHGNMAPSQVDAATPYVTLEQHTYWDLDDDGYAEPYIITIEEQSRNVLRIVARFDSDGIHETDDGEIIAITPVEYYTKYGFIPNPDGGFYDIGFGHLLGPLNEAVNTNINQLVDSGTLKNLQAGFIGKGLRLSMKDAKFQPGEWKSVPVTGDDIKKQIFPLPTAEPSDVLFKLLGLLIESGKELASIAEIFTGKMPGQNTPATTTQASVEQGMKVFTAIFKRVYRAYQEEFKKLFRLNSLYQENFDMAQIILDEPIGPQDYDQKSYDVCPTADPNAVSTTQKMQKAAMLMEVMASGLGTLNPIETTKRILEAQEQPDINALMEGAPGPQADPKVQAMEAKTQMEREKHEMDMKFKQMEMQMKERELQMELRFKEMEAKLEFQISQQDFQQKSQQQVQQAHLDQQTGAMDMQLAEKQGAQQMEQSEQQHQLKMKQTKEAASAKAQTQGNKGAAGSVAKPSGKPSSNKGSSK